METKHIYELVKLALPIDYYHYAVHTHISVDGGKTYWYCGLAKYFKTNDEALSYKKMKEQEDLEYENSSRRV